MRHGTLPYKILNDLNRRRLQFFRTAQVGEAFGSSQSVSRALRKLVEEGKIEAVTRGVYRILTGEPPVLAFDRAWSNPGAVFSPEKSIAVTLARPTFQDVARLCRAYGVERVRKVLISLSADGDIPKRLELEWQHRLNNIQQGFRDAAARQFAH